MRALRDCAAFNQGDGFVGASAKGRDLAVLGFEDHTVLLLGRITRLVVEIVAVFNVVVRLDGDEARVERFDAIFGVAHSGAGSSADAGTIDVDADYTAVEEHDAEVL